MPLLPNWEARCAELVDKVTDGGIIKSELPRNIMGGAALEGFKLLLKSPPSIMLYAAIRRVLIYILAKGRE